MKITPANKHFLMNESGKMKRVSPAGTGSEAAPLVPLPAPASLDAVTPDGASGAVRLVWGGGRGRRRCRGGRRGRKHQAGGSPDVRVSDTVKSFGLNRRRGRDEEEGGEEGEEE